MTDRDLEARVADLERKMADVYRKLGRREPAPASGAIPDPTGGPVAADEDPQVIELVTSGKKAEAIKVYHEIAGGSLGAAKDAVERLEKLYGRGMSR